MSTDNEKKPQSNGNEPATPARFVLMRALRRSRWWIVAVFAHLCLGVCFTLSCFSIDGPGRPSPVEMKLPVESETEIDEVLERDVFENEKEINTGEPPIEDAEVSDHNETDNAEDAVSDKPFQGKYWNAAIGVGGGAGGCFGGRFGGRRNLRAFGGGRPACSDGENHPGHNTESYDPLKSNAFVVTKDDPRSTFSIDVDTASYESARRFLKQGRIPPKGAVRIEEMINYFNYSYSPPMGTEPFAVHMEVAGCPWKLSNRLVRIGIKGRVIEREARPPSNLVFLIDVSGSMRPSNKLPLLRRAMKLLVRQLTDNDHVSIVTYAGRSALVLPSTPAGAPGPILAAIDNLQSGGSTHGSAGIRTAYEQAKKHFVEGGVNRVILATDGDFNVGTTSNDELVELIEAKAKTGVFLTVLGFGMGNYKDDKLEKLADKGNGNYAYIDTINEAKKVLVEQMSGTLITIAKDVKIQVEFNPATVSAWRLIGYENRVLAHRDFNDDTKDAGEIGAGHTVTALYEVAPATQGEVSAEVDPLKYQEKGSLSGAAYSGELLTVKLRHKLPDGKESRLQTFAVEDSSLDFDSATPDFRFQAAVAAFGMLLRDCKHKGDASYEGVRELAQEGLSNDPHGLRAEFVTLVDKAKALAAK
ncbi:MAG: vWA domain-containing protein [Planctomycetota bacterium]|jgi:Ca-activated chloride channel family protein